MENHENYVIFTDDDGNDMEFEHLDTINADKKIYIVCVPVPAEDQSEEEIEEVIIFEALKDDEGVDYFEQVEDELILESVYAEFQERNQDLFDFED